MIRAVALSFLAGLIAAASLPDAGWTNFIYDLTPWNFPVFAGAVGALYFLIKNTVIPAQVGIHSGAADLNVKMDPGLRRDDSSLKWVSLKAGTIAYAWAFGYFVFGLSWVGNALLVDGNPYKWAWPFALVGLPLLLSFFLAIIMAGVVALRRAVHKEFAPSHFIVAFTLAEYARGHFFTGFPWNLPGSYWSETLSVFQTLSLVGIDGLSFLTLLWALTFCLVIKRDIRGNGMFITLGVVTFIASITFGHLRLNTPDTTPTTKLQVVMVQANIPQSEKWDSAKMGDHFYTHLALSQRTDAMSADIPTVIMWPETALPPGMAQSPVIQRAIAGMVRLYAPGSVLLTGSIRVGADGTYYNSVTSFDASGNPTDIYDKAHLVPFGEYMPLSQYIPLRAISQFDGLGAGPGPQTIVLDGIPAFSPLICYEVIFPDGIIDADNLTKPLWLANFTNDSWYGDSPGPYQHKGAARARAIEQGLPIVRVAETGISLAVDKKGRIINEIKYNYQSTSVSILDISENSKMTLFSRLGQSLLFAMIVSLLLLPKLLTKKSTKP